MNGTRLLDASRVAAWLDDLGVAPGEELSVEPLGGGRSNAMFVLRRGDRQLVLRRPAKVAVKRAAEGMRREFRILNALRDTGVPHPEAVALCDDESVLGCTFYVMEHVEGVSPLPVPPVLDDPAGRAEIVFAMVDGLAAVHEVDWRARGLDEIGRPDGFHERQVARWGGQLASYEGRTMPGIDKVMTWLAQHRPPTFEPTLMHGDYHMGNVLIGPDRPARVVAVVDWETATVGDPLLDLVGFCEIWTRVAGPGFPNRDEMFSRYERGSGREVTDVDYYVVLYNFRMAVLLEGIYQRSLRDPTRPVLEDMAERAMASVQRAVAVIGSA